MYLVGRSLIGKYLPWGNYSGLKRVAIWSNLTTAFQKITV